MPSSSGAPGPRLRRAGVGGRGLDFRPARDRHRHQPARHHRRRPPPGHGHLRRRGGHAPRGRARPRPQRARPAHALPAAARAQPGRLPRGGGARRLPLQRIRVGDHQQRGGAEAGVDQPRNADLHRHPLRRVRRGDRRHEPHAEPRRADLRLPPALPRRRRVRPLRAVGHGGGHGGHGTQHVQRRLHHRVEVHLRDGPGGSLPRRWPSSTTAPCPGCPWSPWEPCPPPSRWWWPSRGRGRCWWRWAPPSRP